MLHRIGQISAKALHHPRALIALAVALAGCGAEQELSASRFDAIVYGSDDRRDYFELSSLAIRRRVEKSVVALVPRTLVDVATGAPGSAVPTWGDAADLCAGEPFANE